MSYYVKGNAVANATSYELLENANGVYTSLATASAINFEVSALGLAAGDHILVVKAKADGYEDSEYSNEVTYTVVASGDEETVTPPSSSETIALTSSNIVSSDTDNHLSSTQVVGEEVVLSTVGTKGIYCWDIPAYAVVTLTVTGGGNYGMALCDTNDIVLEYFSNGSVASEAGTTGTYTFGLQTQASKLYVSITKFSSASYTTYTEDELSGVQVSIAMNEAVAGQYVATSQTIGSAVRLSDLSSAKYQISGVIPANVAVTITCKETTSGGYGMALCDTSGNVLEYITHTATAATNNQHTFAVQTIETVLYVSVNKFTSAVYTFQ